MLKRFLSISLLLLVTACVSEDIKICPMVTISRENAYLIQKANYQDDFQVELKGYEGFCFYDNRVKQEKAQIVPIFQITKLRNTDESDIQFSYFTNTIKGPPQYLGRRSYFVSTHMTQGERNKEFKGSPIEVKIPLEMMYDFEIMMGLDISRQENLYNQRLFDVEYKYYVGKPFPEPDIVKLKAYPEDLNADGTPYEPKYVTRKTPSTQKNPVTHPSSNAVEPVQPASSCSSCNL